MMCDICGYFVSVDLSGAFCGYCDKTGQRSTTSTVQPAQADRRNQNEQVADILEEDIVDLCTPVPSVRGTIRHLEPTISQLLAAELLTSDLESEFNNHSFGVSPTPPRCVTPPLPFCQLESLNDSTFKDLDLKMVNVPTPRCVGPSSVEETSNEQLEGSYYEPVTPASMCTSTPASPAQSTPSSPLPSAAAKLQGRQTPVSRSSANSLDDEDVHGVGVVPSSGLRRQNALEEVDRQMYEASDRRDRLQSSYFKLKRELRSVEYELCDLVKRRRQLELQNSHFS